MGDVRIPEFGIRSDTWRHSSANTQCSDARNIRGRRLVQRNLPANYAACRPLPPPTAPTYLVPDGADHLRETLPHFPRHPQRASAKCGARPARASADGQAYGSACSIGGTF